MMTSEQAIDVLVQVANLAQSRGILSLKDANIVLGAIQAVRPEKKEEKTDEKKEEEKSEK